MRSGLTTLVALLGATACATPSWQQAPHDVRFQRVAATTPHPRPTPTAVSEWWTTLSYTTATPLAQALNPGDWIKRALRGPPALDINHFGEVLDSSWYQNRISRRPLSPAQLANGPNKTQGPAPGPLVVLGGKLQGATPGLRVQDSLGARYLIKFDPAAYPELASGAELIATKVLWAAGYHVPENYVLRFDLNRLILREGAPSPPQGKEGALTQQGLRDLIAHVNPYPDGTIRALFSRIIEGEPIGPFSYQGRRQDDPNDRVEHQRRRSLRGLWLLSAWLNNVDTRDANTFDVFLPDPKRPEQGQVKHYLLDFGDALGSAGTQPKYIGEGYEGRLDWPQMLHSLFTAGLWYRRWLPVQRSPYRAVGVFESQVFEPAGWRPSIPNPAFEASDPLDTYWAAALIARFDVDDLVAIVKEAQYSDPGAEAWILRVLLQRQYSILSWAFERVLPLDDAQVQGAYTVQLSDLAVRAGLLGADQVGYSWQLTWHSKDGPVPVGSGQDYTPAFNLEPSLRSLSERAGEALTEAPFLSLKLERALPSPDMPAMQVHLRLLPEGLLMVGIERDVR